MNISLKRFSYILTVCACYFILIDFAVAQHPDSHEKSSLENFSKPELHRRSYISVETGQKREYFLYLPQGYFDIPYRDWPVLFYLHGGGARGNGLEDLNRVLNNGPLYEAWIQKRSLPFLIIAPQLPVFGMDSQVAHWQNKSMPQKLKHGTPSRYEFCSDSKPADNSSPNCLVKPHRRAYNIAMGKASPIARKGNEQRHRIQPFNMDFLYPPDKWPLNGWYRVEQDLITILDDVLQHFRGNSNKVYLTGISYGAHGTFDLAASYPNRWAAIAPISGTGNLSDASILAENEIPIWIFGGGADPLNKPHWLIKMGRELEKYGHPEVRLTIHEDMTHDAWRRVYEGEDLFNWFLSKRLKKQKQSNSPK